MDTRALGRLLEHGTHVAELQIKEGNQQVLIKDVQFGALDPKPIHVDFARVDLAESVQVSVPLEFKGKPAGLEDGGMFVTDMVDIEIECRVSDIPDSIRVNVGDMKLEDVLHVSDLKLPEGMTVVSAPDTVVCSVRVKAAEVEQVEAAEGEAQQPEIIGRKEKDEGSDSDAS
jgi:large subunit ribosomal protein L25